MNIGISLPYGCSVLTPWMSRRAGSALFSFELTSNPDDVLVTITLLDRDEADYGDGADGEEVIFASGIATLSVTGLRELVRFRIEVPTFEEETQEATGIVYRMLEPTWYDEATPA